LIDTPYHDKIDPWSSHSLIRDWLKAFPPNTRVLDVGTATGTLGRMCQGWNLRLRGLEPNPVWVEQARPFYSEILTGTLEDIPDEFLTGHQVVVCADVLEHMPAPQTALCRLVALQPAGAIFMISVPNIANLYVRLALLLGHFDYTDRGILDRTHLHFFTRRTFRAFLQEAGLAIQHIQPTPIPLPLIHPFFLTTAVGRWMHTLLAWLTRRLPTLLGYQFVVCCIKAPQRNASEGSV
jgi:2-polyprenyl-3-methyl-5-hydroxy-6-metoxy-1,4-benzoquinol methylase